MIHTLWELSPFAAGLLASTLAHFSTIRPHLSAARIAGTSLLLGAACSLLAGELIHDVATAALSVGYDSLAALSGIATAHLFVRRVKA